MASTLSGPNIEEEYLWACTINAKDKEYEWNPEDPAETEDDEEDPPCKPNHRLLIKQAILGPDAKEGEVTMLQVETLGYNDTKICAPILAMKAGAETQRYLDVLIPDTAKIKLIQGSGPVTLVGSHCVDFYDYRNYGQGEDSDDELGEEEAASGEDDEADMEEQETAAPPKELKTKKKKEEEKKKKEEEEEEEKMEEEEEKAKKSTPSKGKKKSEADDEEKKEGKKAEEAEDKEKSPTGGSGKKNKNKRKSQEEDASKKRKASEEPATEAPGSGKKKRKGSGDK